MAAKTSISFAVFWAAFSLMGTHSFAFATKAPPAAPTDDAQSSSSLAGGPTVWVTRPDGAQQCAPGSGQTLESGASELEKAQVRIVHSQKGSDHKLHAQMCGIPSGKNNMFEIPKDDLPKALALGFHEVK
jgi:hypothetical protein